MPARISSSRSKSPSARQRKRRSPSNRAPRRQRNKSRSLSPWRCRNEALRRGRRSTSLSLTSRRKPPQSPIPNKRKKRRSRSSSQCSTDQKKRPRKACRSKSSSPSERQRSAKASLSEKLANKAAARASAALAVTSGEKDSKDTKVAKESKDVKDTKTTKVAKDAKDTKDTRDAKETKGDRDVRDAKGARDTKGAKDVRDVKDTKDGRDAKDGEGLRDAKDTKGARDAKDGRDSKEGKDPKKTKDKDRSKRSTSPSKQNGKHVPSQDSVSARSKRSPSAAEKEKRSSGRRRSAFQSLSEVAIAKQKESEQKAAEQKVDEPKGQELKVAKPKLDLSALQRTLDEERQRLKMFVIKAKQEWEEKAKNITGVTDEQDYYHASVGECFGPTKQFQMEEKIGKGVFSNVFKCKDTDKGGQFAVKFIRANSIMRRVSEKEVEIYRHIAAKAPSEDPEGYRHLIRLMGPETFEHRGHLCLVFDLLKCDLRFALQKYGAGKGLQLGTIQQYGQQIFMALRALRRLKLIHADLKPDNVLMSLDKTVVQLIDFGSAMYVSEAIGDTAYVQPRYYRAPEVMLGMSYDTQVDVWSLGTTLFELATARILFAGASNNGMIKQMLDICGATFPASMRSSGTFAGKHFNSDGDFLCKDPDDNFGQEKVIPMQRFKQPTRPILGRLEGYLTEPPEGMNGDFHKAMVQQFADLLCQCSRPDPTKRITPEQALSHAFFKQPVS